MKPNLFFLFFFLSIAQFTVAQEAEMEKMERNLEHLPADKQALFFRLTAEKFLKKENKNPLPFALKALNISQLNNIPEEEVQSHLLIGNIRLEENNYPEARNHFRQVILQSPACECVTFTNLAYSKIGFTYFRESQSDSMFFYLRKGIVSGEKAKDWSGAAANYNNTGLAYWTYGNYDSAEFYHLKALEAREIIGDSLAIGKSLNNLGVIFWKKGIYSRALTYYEASLAYRKGNDPRGEVLLNCNIGLIYSRRKKYDISLDYQLVGLKKAKDISYPVGMAYAYANIGGIQLKKGEIDRAISYYDSALQTYRSADSTLLNGSILNNLGNAYLLKNEPDKARKFYMEALKKATSTERDYYRVQSLTNLVKISLKQGKINEAKTFHSEALEAAKTRNFTGLLPEIYELGMQIAETESKPFEALRFAKLHRIYADSAFRQENKKTLADAENAYNLEMTEKQNKILRQGNLLYEKELSRKNFSLWVLFFVLLLLLSGAIYYYYNLQNTRKISKLIHTQSQELKLKNEEVLLAYQTLQTAQARLIQVEKTASLGQLTGAVAHEINNPINFVLVGSDVLEENLSDLRQLLQNHPPADLTEEQSGELSDLLESSLTMSKDIRAGALRTVGIVKSLRNFSRLDEDKIKEISISENIESVLILVRHLFEGASLETDLEADLPPVECNPSSVNQVVLSFLLNALQAIDRDGKVVVSAGRLSEKPEMLQISVEDNGRGISPENLKHIFDPLFSTGEAGKSSGMGLTLSREIAENHKGRIEVRSEVGQGSLFSLIIPF